MEAGEFELMCLSKFFPGDSLFNIWHAALAGIAQ